MNVLFVCLFVSQFLFIFSVFLSLFSANSSSLTFTYLFLPSFPPVFLFISAPENLHYNAVWVSYFCILSSPSHDQTQRLVASKAGLMVDIETSVAFFVLTQVLGANVFLLGTSTYGSRSHSEWIANRLNDSIYS